MKSDRLSYAWVVAYSQSTRTAFCEFLMQLQQLVILKVYPLTLETFRVCFIDWLIDWFEPGILINLFIKHVQFSWKPFARHFHKCSMDTQCIVTQNYYSNRMGRNTLVHQIKFYKTNNTRKIFIKLFQKKPHTVGTSYGLFKLGLISLNYWKYSNKKD